MSAVAGTAGSIIYLEDVTVDYDGFKALDGLNFYMDHRELRVVIGPNGAGKTTLLDVISGKVTPSAGRVIFGRSTSLVGRREDEIAAPRHRPQVPDALRLRQPDGSGQPRAVVHRASKGVLATLRHRPDATALHRIEATLETVNLAGRGHERAGGLSHGEKQWLEIGMVLVQQAELLLVDEPVAGMTDEETERTAGLLRAVAEERAVLVIEHDMEFVRSIARRVTVLHEGSVLCEGSVAEVQQDERVMQVYLGRSRDAAVPASARA